MAPRTFAAATGTEPSPFARTLALLAILFVSSAGRIVALDPASHISQYGHSAWRIQDGYFHGTLEAVAQTADGYLWIGTEAGLLRFDGVSFVPWTPPPGQQLPSPSISYLLGTADGSLWIGTNSGVSRLLSQNLTNFDLRGNVGPILEDSDHSVWFVYGNFGHTPLCHIVETAITCYEQKDGIPYPSEGGLLRDGAGNLWLSTRHGVVRWRPDSFSVFEATALRSFEGSDAVEAIAFGSGRSILVGMAMPGPGLGLQQLTDGIWRSYQKPGLDGTKITAARLFVDREGSLWIGTLQQGIFRVHGQKVEHFTSADGLSGDFVRSLYEDREGNLWVVTSKGVDLFRDLRVASFSTREGIGTEEVESVLASRDGTIWVGGAESLDAIRNDGVSSVRSGKGLPGGQVGALFEDHAGNLWVGVDQKLFIYKNQIFKPITRSDGSPVGSVKSVTEDGDNNIWVSTWHGLVRSVLRIRDFKVQEELPNSQIPPSRQVIADSQRNLWLAPLNGGLARFNNGQIETIAFEGMKDSRIEQLIIASDGSVLGATEAGVVAWKNNIRRTLTVQNGLPCNGAHGIINDAQGNLWLNLRCGLVKVTDVELKKWWENSDPLHPRVFDTFDGAQAGRAFWSSAARSTDGRLWFANGTVLQMIDPAHIPVNYVAPPVHVERIIADRNTYLPQNGVTVPPLTRDLEIDYAALSFGVPQKVLFRYKLEGRDTNWIEAATRRQAFYNDLRPGRYRFRVIACNNDGLWNEAGASLDFSILPAYYQTTWFRMACAVASLVLLWAIYQFRVRQLHRQFAIGMEARVNERTRIAQDLHDTLLQGFISASMQLGVADRQLPADWPAKSIVTDVLNLMRDVIEEGRKAVRGMRLSSEDSDDLERAFLRIPQELVVQRSVGFRVLVEGQVRSLHPLIRDEVYRIGREALVNAFRHSQAASIEVELEYADRELRVLVRDNGCGIDPQVLQSGREGHWGLSGMRERAGRIDARLKVWSDAAAGTEIELSVPSRFAYRLDASLRGLRWFAGFGRRKGGDHAQKPGNER